MTTSRKYLFGGEAPWSKQDWTTCDDRVRGGVSTSVISIKAPTVAHQSSSAFFHGHLDITALGGAGFASQRNTTSTMNWRLEDYDGIELVIGKSDGKRYSFVLKDEMLPKRPDGREQSSLNWEHEFTIPAAKETEEQEKEGTVLRVKWCDFVPTYRGRPKEGLGRCLKPNEIKRVTLMIRSFFGEQSGDFEVEVASVAAFKECAQAETPTPIRQDGGDMTEKLREQEQQAGRPPPSRESADSMVSKPTKEADEQKRPHERERRRNPILRFFSSCCGSR